MITKTRPSVLTRAILLAGGVTILWLLQALLWNPTEVSWSQRLAEHGDRVEFFYAHDPGQYSLDRSVMRNAAADRWLDYAIQVPGLRRVRSIRIDPSQLEDHRIRIGPVTIRTRWGESVWQGEALARALVGKHDYRLVSSDAGQLVIHSRGNDAHFALPVPRDLVYPAPVRLAGQAAAVFMLVLALTYGLAGTAWRRWLNAPARVVTEYPTRMMAIVSLAGVLALGAAWVQVAETTPFFQGPDEGAHAANAFYAFNNAGMERDSECGDVWAALNAVKAEFDYMIRRFTLPLEPAAIEALAQIRDQYPWQATGEQLETALHRSCNNHNLINGLGYGVFSISAFQAGGADDVVDWLRLTRLGQGLVGLVFVGLLLTMIIRGHSLLTPIVPHSATTLRWVALLATLFYLAMPQNLFMSGVINREAFLVPLGMSVLLAFFFWHRWLTPLLIALALYAFWPSRVIYWLIPGLWLFWVGLLFFYRRRPWLAIFALPGGLAFAGYAIGPIALLGLLSLHDYLPFSMPQRLAIEEDFWHFHREVIGFIQRIWTLAILEWRSFFGYLGSLDTPLSPLARTTWQIVFAGLPAVFALGLWINRPIPWRGLARFCLMVMAFAVPLALTIGAITYGGYQVYVHDGLEAWGTQVQGRYFLPVYFYIFLVYFFLAASPFIVSKADSFDGRRPRVTGSGWLVVGLVAVVAVAFWVSVQVTLDGLYARYFVAPADFEVYRQIFWGQENAVIHSAD